MLWNRIKTVLRKKVIGQQNADRLTFTQQILSAAGRRFLRSGRRLISARKRPELVLRRFSVAHSHTFFGYYDVTPFNRSDDRVLAMVAPPINRSLEPDDEIRIGYFEIGNSDSFQEVGRTTTWCWQQGCRLSWFPGGADDLIVYNKLVDGAYGCVVQSTNDRSVVKAIGSPLYDIDSSGRRALSLDFSRLQRLRPGYGYVSLADQTEGCPCPDDNGIWLVDLKSGDEELIINLAALALLESDESMTGAEHYINHISFNPCGDRFMFFHLWVKQGMLFNRLIISDRTGDNLRILENKGTVSNYTWKTNRDLLVTVNYDNGACHYNLYRNLDCVPVRVGKDILTVDGHPSYQPGSEALLTDTYPDDFGEQRLIVFDSGSGTTILGRYRLPLRYRGETRCDLHPRWNRKGNRVCFDSSHSGIRALYVADI